MVRKKKRWNRYRRAPYLRNGSLPSLSGRKIVKTSMTLVAVLAGLGIGITIYSFLPSSPVVDEDVYSLLEKYGKVTVWVVFGKSQSYPDFMDINFELGRVYPIYDSNGRVVHLLTYFEDLSRDSGMVIIPGTGKSAQVSLNDLLKLSYVKYVFPALRSSLGNEVITFANINPLDKLTSIEDLNEYYITIVVKPRVSADLISGYDAKLLYSSEELDISFIRVSLKDAWELIVSILPEASMVRFSSLTAPQQACPGGKIAVPC